MTNSVKRLFEIDKHTYTLTDDNDNRLIQGVPQEVELVSKERRKEAYRGRRARLDAEHGERERSFVAGLAEASDALLRRLHENHRERQALADRQYLQQRQQVITPHFQHNIALTQTQIQN